MCLSVLFIVRHPRKSVIRNQFVEWKHTHTVSWVGFKMSDKLLGQVWLQKMKK